MRQPRSRAAESRSPAPARTGADGAQLRQVAEGASAFSAGQREWCIGEAVVRTAFECTPEQLLAAGDPALARLLLDDAVPA
jgi:hypothetical protein